MDPARLVEMEFRISHHHNDGSSSAMVEVTPHDSAAHDPERHWGFRRIFRCTSCEETITIEPGSNDEDPGPGGR